jgi:hypothetical protein
MFLHGMKLLAVQTFRESFHGQKVRIGESHQDVGMDFAWKKVVQKRLAGGNEVEWRTRVFAWPAGSGGGEGGVEVVEGGVGGV